MPFRNKKIIFQNNFLQRLVKARAFLKKKCTQICALFGSSRGIPGFMNPSL